MEITVRNYRNNDLPRIREILAEMPSPTGRSYNADEREANKKA